MNNYNPPTVEYLGREFVFDEKIQRAYDPNNIEDYVLFSEIPESTLSMIREAVKEDASMENAKEQLLELLTGDNLIGWGSSPLDFVEALIDNRDDIITTLMKI